MYEYYNKLIAEYVNSEDKKYYELRDFVNYLNSINVCIEWKGQLNHYWGIIMKSLGYGLLIKKIGKKSRRVYIKNFKPGNEKKPFFIKPGLYLKLKSCLKNNKITIEDFLNKALEDIEENRNKSNYTEEFTTTFEKKDKIDIEGIFKDSF